eukprot:SAG22_NODE_1646_length_3900_cov_8.380952_3_plen_161_part_00
MPRQVLFAMIAGAYPFDFGYHGGVGPDDKRGNSELMAKLRRADYKLPNGLSPELGQLFGSLLQPDVAKRLDAKGALLHPWALGTGGGGCGLDSRTAEHVEALHRSFGHDFVKTPEGDDPTKWLAVLNQAGDAAAAAAGGGGGGGGGDGTVDVQFDEDDAF